LPAKVQLVRFEYDIIIRDRNEINKELINVIGDSIGNRGVICTRFEIEEFSKLSQSKNKEVFFVDPSSNVEY